MNDRGPGWYIKLYPHCWWIVLGLYVLRIGKPWGHPYKYVWRPLFKFFKCYRCW